jgi:chromosome segregation ATPase
MKRCDALQASVRDARQELSGVEEQLARAVSACSEAESKFEKSLECELSLRSHIAALETAMVESASSSKYELAQLQQLYMSYQSSSVDDTQKLLDERSELSSLLQSLRTQLDICKASALEERQKLRDERFDIGCLLAAESEKCEILEARVLCLEGQLAESVAMLSNSQPQAEAFK